MKEKQMKTLGGYEIVDEKARKDIETISEKADEAYSLAKGATKAFVYDTYSDMIVELNALDKAELLVNFHVMIREVCVPDLWISGISDEHVEYTYTSNEDFIVDLTEDGVVQVGYFVLSALETQKVDLSEYVKKTDYATGSTPGIVRPTLGLTVGNNGMFYIAKAAKSQINAKTNGYNPITPELLDYAVKKALSDCKLTGDDVWTEEEKAKARNRLGVPGYVSGLIDGIKTFVAEYGVTTYEELLNAFKSNKQLILHVPAGKTSEKQPMMYARLHRLDGNGDSRNFIFVCTEHGKDHHFLLGYVNDWTYWCYDQESRFEGIDNSISSLNNNIGSMKNTLTNHTNTLNSNQTNINTLLQTAFDKFRGGFVNNAGTLHITHPGIYLIIQGGRENKTITIKYPTGKKEFEATDWSGIILLAYESGVVTPIGIKSSLLSIDAFQLPGTFQGWTTDGSYSTTINYPAKCVVAYLGNGNVNYLA